MIAAPGKIERPSSDRVKTDQRDAERLLRLLMIDGLHAVRVPTTQEESLRDLVRAREDIRGDLMRARHRMSKLLLRHDVRFDGTAAAWTTHHRAWLAKVDLGDRGAQITLQDYLGAIDALLVLRDTLEARSTSSCPARRGRTRSPGCAACAASTPCRRSGCARRSVTGLASPRPGTS